jgi:hypothetical protein
MKKNKVDNARTASDQIDKERQKKTAEVFTPPELINEMLDQIDIEMFKPGKTWLEPAAGDGNMVIEILKRKMHHGCTPTEAIQDVYAVEYMKDNHQAMIKRVLELVGDNEIHQTIVNNNIVHANFIDESDTEDGRCYPKWLRSTSIESFFS